MMKKNYLIMTLLLAACCTASAQRDYSLTEERNAWLKSANSAALTTYSDSSIAKAEIGYGYVGGRYHGISEGSNEMTVKADVRSYYTLSDKVTGYGSATYTNASGTNMSGSMLYGMTGGIKPFDIIQPEEDAGRKHLELINVTGAVGWHVWQGLSVGAKAAFSAGNYSKYKDLRHASTLMNLDANASLFYSWETTSLGASFLYGRGTETVQYKTFGTTDHVYHVLLDYANRIGETITYGGDGFIDHNTELPFLDEHCGLSVQAGLKFRDSYRRKDCGSMMLSFTYLHRNGFYGPEAQYTASYAQHKGDSYAWLMRLNMPQTRNTLSWITLGFNSEGVTTSKKNYRQVKETDKNNAIHYDYYEPTKISDKIMNSADLGYTLYAIPKGAIFLWQLHAGTQYLYSKQTAYTYPLITTRKATLWTPYITARRNIIFRNSSVMGIELGFSAQCGDMDIMMDGKGRQTREAVKVSYEFPFLSLRTNVTLRYACSQANDNAYNRAYRHEAMLSVGAMF